jgi:hypothetical protein
LEAGLGSAFTPELKESWAKTYADMTTIMKVAARTNTFAA